MECPFDSFALAQSLRAGSAPPSPLDTATGDAALIDGTRAGAARVAACATGAARTAGFLRLFSADGKAGKLLAQPFALTLGACGLFAA
jgi:hypothetical protein